ncbi:unnamed protein product [Brachionus calyciflorus]|uniref:Uncharacterized protein n=1 Tax=Brachionus calyciflorus TaxID=104777 RepID=A0A814FX42_9BILA|nr:unnamed protein product [Brachionus calyciflorus]
MFLALNKNPLPFLLKNNKEVHNGRYLITAAPFNKNNINLYVTKLLSILFTKEELANGTVEPIRTRVQSLDQERIDMIKNSKDNEQNGNGDFYEEEDEDDDNGND